MLDEGEYLAALREKLVEEAREATEAHAEGLVGELGDVLELMDALMGAAGIDAADVAAVRERKRVERGGFEERICLMWTE